MRQDKKRLDYRFQFKPLLIAALLAILSASLLNADSDSPTADNKLQAFHDVKDIHVNLAESFGEAESLRMFVKKDIDRLVSTAGFTPAGPRAPLTLEIKLNGKALAKLYSIHGVGSGTKFFSGATINGHVALLAGDRLVVKKGFKGFIAPPRRVSGHSPPPFRKALSQSAFLRQVIGLFLGIKGNDLISDFIGIKDYEIRKTAVYMAGNLKITSAVEPLLTLLKERPLIMPETIALALTEIADPRAVSPLLDLSLLMKLELSNLEAILQGLTKMDPQWSRHSRAVAMDDELFQHLRGKSDFPRRKAIAILGETYRPNALEPLLATFTTNKKSRESAIEVLDRHEKLWRTLPATQAFAKNLVEKLSDKQFFVRREACYTIAAIASPDTKISLIHALKDSHVSVFLAVREALDKAYPDWGSHEAAIAMIPYFEARYKEASSRQLQNGILGVFASINSPRLTSYLIDALNGKNIYLKLTAAKGLFKKNTPEALKCLTDNLASRTFNITRDFLSYINGSSAPPAREILMGVLESKRKRNRDDALEFLLQREDVSNKKELLARYREDRSSSVRRVVYRTLLEEPTPGLTENLMADLNGSGAKARKFAVEFLEEINKKHPLSLENLIQLLAVNYQSATRVAYKTLLTMHQNSEECLLCPYIEHDNKNVRESIYNMLQKKPDRRAVPLLIKSLSMRKGKELNRISSLLGRITAEKKIKNWIKWWEMNKNNY